MWRPYGFGSALVTSFGLLICSAHSQSGNLTEEQLRTLERATNVVCGSFQTGGSSKTIALDGGAKAELDGILKKLAELSIGVGGTGKINIDEYSGVLRDKLGPELKDIRDCRRAIWSDLQSRFFTGRQGHFQPPDGSRPTELAVVTVDKLQARIQGINGDNYSTTVNLLITNMAEKPAMVLLHRSSENKPRLAVLGGATGTTELVQGLQWCSWSKAECFKVKYENWTDAPVGVSRSVTLRFEWVPLGNQTHVTLSMILLKAIEGQNGRYVNTEVPITFANLAVPR